MSSANTITLDVQGMSCASCVRHVEGALRGLEGVLAVEVRLHEGKVLVERQGDAPLVTSMIDAIRDAGYESKPAA